MRTALLALPVFLAALSLSAQPQPPPPQAQEGRVAALAREGHATRQAGGQARQLRALGVKPEHVERTIEAILATEQGPDGDALRGAP
jgi:hypothetical protein